jgi:beta-galactosidase GanA
MPWVCAARTADGQEKAMKVAGVGLRRSALGGIVLLVAGAFAATFAGQAETPAFVAGPSIVQKDGHYALMVDGAPYLMLGVQANNSSAWPDYLAKVWPAVETLHANTVELPIYWEQLEATPGVYDFSLVDQIVKQARSHHLHLVLLWFGTWKNGSSHYTPEWMKLDQVKYPFLVGKDGQTVDSPSTFSPARLEADKAAFRALMHHLEQFDTQYTVIMMQVENEAGVWGSVRDYSPEAEKAFAGPVPEKLVKGLGKQPGTWRQVFGDEADETFQAWCIATYIEQVAQEGKATHAIPLYVNAALRDPFNPGHAPSYESGAPTDNNIALWKIAAPSIDVIAPDIYQPEYAKYIKTMELYKRANNPLLIPESGNSVDYARYVFAAIGQGTIGWSPFGLDLNRSGFFRRLFHSQNESEETMMSEVLKPFAQQYELLAPVARLLAKANYEGKLRGVSEDPAQHTQTLAFDRWTATVNYGMPTSGNEAAPTGNSPPEGGVVVVQLGDDEFLVAGHEARVDFTPAGKPGKKRLWLKVEEGRYDSAGNWKMARIWNGDQTDYGLNLKPDENLLLRVRLTTF